MLCLTMHISLVLCLSQCLAVTLCPSLRVHNIRCNFQVARYGFCIDTEEYPRISFKVGLCVGSSDSDDERTGRIQIHHPDRAEIEEAKLTFTRILEKLGDNAPLMVTLCRSMRDGYAPRAYWQEVETSVLNAVGQMAERTSSTSQVVYDRNLYFGKDGYQQNDHT